MSQTTIRLATTGMHCRSCSMLIDMTVGDLDGVTHSESDAAAGTTVVTFDPDVVTVEKIIAAIEGAGYSAELES